MARPGIFVQFLSAHAISRQGKNFSPSMLRACQITNAGQCCRSAGGADRMASHLIRRIGNFARITIGYSNNIFFHF